MASFPNVFDGLWLVSAIVLTALLLSKTYVDRSRMYCLGI